MAWRLSWRAHVLMGHYVITCVIGALLVAGLVIVLAINFNYMLPDVPVSVVAPLE